jgi:hypothetical protein
MVRLGGFLSWNETRKDREVEHRESDLKQSLAKARAIAAVLCRLSVEIDYVDQPRAPMRGETDSS